jgi:fused signal recognition particle receptor
MLKWFRRDKNDPLAESVPVPAPASRPAESMAVQDSEGVGPQGQDEPAVQPSAAMDPEADGAAGVAAAAIDSMAPASAAITQSVTPAEPAASVEASVPWWRYEGVWRAPKPAAPREGAPGLDAGAPSGSEQATARIADEQSGPDQALAHPAEVPAGRDPEIFAEPDDAVPSLFVPEAPAAEPAKPRSLRERLAATARALTASVGSLFRRNPKLDDELLEELETALIQADVGVTASTELVAKLGVRMRKREFADAQALLAALRNDLRALIVNHARPLQITDAPRPFVILTVGVNGAGKTTTIGKLAMRYKQAGHSVMLAAGDTFRAAAVEQLKTWGERNQVSVIAQGSGADSASVIFDALQAAKSRGIDVLIADTAGRLHTQGHLMQELAKVKRVLGKIDPAAPHETLLVIDGGTGQNALVQAKQFHQAVGLTGIVVTKLDGTAKGGMVFALCRELGLPIRFIGVGEKREDLREFDAEDFVDALLPRELGG